MLALALLLAAFAQDPSQEPKFDPLRGNDARLPNGKLQRDEILKAEHQKSIQDAAELIRLTEELKSDLEKSGPNIMSIQSIHKTEEIEKLAKRIRARLKR